MMVWMNLVYARRGVAVVLLGMGVGCRRRVQAPLTMVAPIPGSPYYVLVDLTHPEQHPEMVPMMSAEQALQKRRAVKIEPAAASAMLARRPVNLAYPVEAKERRLSGSVVLRTIVGEDGTVKGLTVLSSSDPSFISAAEASVQSWQYRPYLLNGKPAAIDTTVTVNFTYSE
jgi:TonB family protein